MKKGTVELFMQDKGFGFIIPNDGGDDVFVHRKIYGDGNDRSAYLEEGQEVEFESEWDDRTGKEAATSCTGWKTEVEEHLPPIETHGEMEAELPIGMSPSSWTWFKSEWAAQQAQRPRAPCFPPPGRLLGSIWH